MLGSLGVILFTLVVVGGVVWLQIYLSKRESRWPGLIIPAIQLVLSILATVGSVVYAAVPLESVAVTIAAQAVIIFLLSNIPTLISLAIYFVCRVKLRRAISVGFYSYLLFELLCVGVWPCGRKIIFIKHDITSHNSCFLFLWLFGRK